MAIAFDVAVTADSNALGPAATISAVHTCGSLTNGVVYAALCTDNSGDLQTELASGVVTYGGAAMAFVGKAVVSNQNIFLYRKIAPAAGANTCTFTWATSCGFAFIVASFSGVDQTTPERNFGSAGATSIAPAVSVTSAVGDLVAAIVNFNNDDSLLDGAGQTRVLDGYVLQGGNGITAAILTTKAGAAGSVANSWTPAGSDRWGAIAISLQAPASAATLSSPTPSGTLGTTTTATVGATTNQTTGTLYAVVDSAANLSGVTASQIKAGQKASGAAALASGNSAVSTTTPSIGITGLSASTLYSYAIVQNNANGDSNVSTGTFTTAAATHAASLTIVDAAGANVASTAITWWAIQSNVIVGNGTNSTNGSGLLSLTIAGASAGTATLVYRNAGNTLSGERDVTVS